MISKMEVALLFIQSSTHSYFAIREEHDLLLLHEDLIDTEEVF